MSERYNGGPAFPVDTRGSGESEDSGTYGHQTGPTTWQFSGMNLRDYFAAKALANPYTTHDSAPDKVAEWAYQVADAMLAARQAT